MTLTTRRPAQPAPPRPRARAFRHLALTNWRELCRDPKTLFFSMVFPFVFLLMFSAMGMMMDRAGDPPQVAVTGAGASAITKSLSDHDVAVTGSARGANVLVRAEADRVGVVIQGDKTVAKGAVVDAIHDTGISKADVAVVQSDGSAVFDPLRGALPTVLMLALLSLAFLGTAAPLVGLRQHGTLRLLGTTPLRRLTFIAAQSPARITLGAVQVLLIAGYAHWLGYLDLRSAGTLLVSCTIGLAMVLSLGYLLASRMANQDLATTIASLTIPVAMIFAGGMMPPQLIPDSLRVVTDHLPTTILSEAMSTSLVGNGDSASLPGQWAVMAAITVGAVAFASLLFKWDQGEQR